MKKNVLFVMTSLYNGGAEKSLVNLLNEFSPERYNVDLLLFKKMGIFLEQVPKWVNILDTPKELETLFMPDNVKGEYIVKTKRLIWNVISKALVKIDSDRKAFRWKHCYGKIIKKLDKKYDVVCGYISGEVLYYIDEKVSADRKVVWVHNDYKAEKQCERFDRPYMKKMDGIVSISEKCVEVLKDTFPEDKEKIVNIPNLTSSKVIKNQSKELYPDEMNGDFLKIVSVGRLSNQKGFDMAINAAALLKSKNIAFKWFVIGNGSLEEELKKQIEACDVKDEFILLGPKYNPYVYMGNADLVLQTSRFEGKSVVLDEAKILAIPIVVTNYNTVRDQIIDGKEGIIVDMNPEAIAEGIISLISENDKYEEIKSYLECHEYGNQSEIVKYYDVIDGR